MMQTTLMLTLFAAATAKMTKWDTTCGSKFDRINTDTLTMTTADGKFAAGDTVTIDTAGSCNLHGPFMGGSWSVRVYEEGFSHPVGDYTGDLAKVLSFPDSKNTTFKIDGVQFPFPKNAGQNIFQISFTAQDFSHATYFCVDIYYNLDTGEMTTTKNVEASLLTSASPALNLTAGQSIECEMCKEVVGYALGNECDAALCDAVGVALGPAVGAACSTIETLCSTLFGEDLCTYITNECGSTCTPESVCEDIDACSAPHPPAPPGGCTQQPIPGSQNWDTCYHDNMQATPDDSQCECDTGYYYYEPQQACVSCTNDM